MYSLDQIRKAVRHPNLICREINRLAYTGGYSRECNDSGINIISADWDNNIILDACRFDIFKEMVQEEKGWPQGKLRKEHSRGSATREFLHANFNNKELHDTVYVTANPQLYRMEHNTTSSFSFHAVKNIWKDNWDEEYQTVLPETTTDIAIDTERSFPNKRLVVHYIQPHYPFITDETEFDKGHLETENSDSPSFWQQLMKGKLEIDKEQLWKLYKENLERAIPEVIRLIDNLNGKTVVTSDHGNMFGERASPLPIKEWGHPKHIHTPELVEIPWFICDSDGRKGISEENPIDHEDIQRSKVNERLRNLGYAD